MGTPLLLRRVTSLSLVRCLLLHLLLLAFAEAFPFGRPLTPLSASKPDFETAYPGGWQLMTSNAGVSAMHLVITPNNKAVMFDSTIMQTPPLKLQEGNCRPVPRSDTGEVDCSVHAVEFDLETAKSRPLKVLTDTWCSSGGLAADGTLVQTGGFLDGGRAVRYLRSCSNCDWEEYPESFTGERWYASQVTLPDGGFIVAGGRHQFSYEYVPHPGESNAKAFELRFLFETTDDVENNLYPFVHLSTDGNIFIFANNRAILLDPKNNAVARNFPELKGGSRNYPASGMSALLPIKLRGPGDNRPLSAEVIVCGGANRRAFTLAAKGIFPSAVGSCGRLVITKPDADWHMEMMPSPRTMGDMLILPNADLLLINGAKKGCSGWWFAREPAMEPVLYKPALRRQNRFRTLAAAATPRMYHATSAVLPDTSVLVAGSNPNNGYNYTNVMYRTEVSVERFYPPYFDPLLVTHRPQIDESTLPSGGIAYGESFELEFILTDLFVGGGDIKVTMYAPPFTTHGYSMNQRILILNTEDFFFAGLARYRIVLTAPPSGEVAPPGYYMLFVVNRGVPSPGVWIRMHHFFP